ncbi:MAG: hypothetical protein WCJ45_08240 [bacterium]
MRNTDSNTKHTIIVFKSNFQNDTLRNPKENWPGIDNGGVIFTISSEIKKLFFILRSRYFMTA